MIDERTETPNEAARRWAQGLAGVDGILRTDLEAMVQLATGCDPAAAHAAVLDATEEAPRGGWQVKGRLALEVAELRDELAARGLAAWEINREVAAALAAVLP